jgi:hypothetical protein
MDDGLSQRVMSNDVVDIHEARRDRIKRILAERSELTIWERAEVDAIASFLDEVRAADGPELGGLVGMPEGEGGGFLGGFGGPA